VTTVGVGVDVVDVARFALALERHPRLAERLFTDAERADARAQPERLAARFAAKEAVLKTLRSGMGAAPWRSIEIRRDPNGEPRVRLHGAAASLAKQCGARRFHVSLSHTETTAVAFVVASSKKDKSNAR
jgi:holo-[acyl-carrier protein] synthase